jgi:alanyl-tRNA synthetase
MMGAAHTAEHLFAGSLRNIQPGIKVVKVDQSDDRNNLFIEAERLDWDMVLNAEARANQAIFENRVIREYFFSSLEEAKQGFPGLRAMEERISGEVRVVEIDGYDYAACSREHASSTGECGFFLVTRVVKAGQTGFQIDFAVGNEAKVKALELSKIALSVGDILGAPLGSVEKTVENMRSELSSLRRRLASMSEQAVEEITASERSGVKIYSKMFEGLNVKRLIKKAGELTAQANSVVLLANLTEDATVILARSSDGGFDAGSLLREVLAVYGGQGGGRPEFASGRVDLSKVDSVFKDVLDNVFSK